MTKLRDNKAFQTVVGGAVLYLTFRLWQEGLFDRLLNKDDPEGFEGPEVWLAVGQALLSFVQLVGIVTIGIVSGILPHLESMLEFLGKQLRGLFDKGKEFVAKNKDAQPGEQWNWKPLAAIILSWFLYANGILGEAWEVIKENITNEEVLPEGKPEAVAFLIDPTTATSNQMDVVYSQKLDQFFEQKKIERRTISTDQSVKLAEPWLREIVDRKTGEGSLLAIYFAKDDVKYISIPDNIQDTQKLFN
jgi:hypothetical protein